RANHRVHRGTERAQREREPSAAETAIMMRRYGTDKSVPLTKPLHKSGSLSKADFFSIDFSARALPGRPRLGPGWLGPGPGRPRLGLGPGRPRLGPTRSARLGGFAESPAEARTPRRRRWAWRDGPRWSGRRTGWRSGRRSGRR